MVKDKKGIAKEALKKAMTGKGGPEVTPKSDKGESMVDKYKNLKK